MSTQCSQAIEPGSLQPNTHTCWLQLSVNSTKMMTSLANRATTLKLLSRFQTNKVYFYENVSGACAWHSFSGATSHLMEDFVFLDHPGGEVYRRCCVD